MSTVCRLLGGRPAANASAAAHDTHDPETYTMKPRVQIAVALLLVFVIAASAHAQRLSRVPPPKPDSLTTDDGVQLAITYYASTEGKNATPVVMLHDYKGSRAIFAPLAQRLQSPGEKGDQPSFAVVTVDLRGHGDSTRQMLPYGQEEEIDAAKLNKNDFLAMVALDMKAVRKFLVTKNDAGELNLNKLCLVGTGLGASVAANWAATDWAWPPLAVGKQGQDVKALVLISPRWKDRGLSMQTIMRPGPFREQFRREVAWLLVYGKENPRVQGDCARIFKQLERYHPDASAADAGHPSDLVALGWPSSLQGDSLLSQVGTPINDRIVEFLTVHVAKEQFPWISRRDRL
jgi:pimeloyl-ACP methyl ester carboxylesterase